MRGILTARVAATVLLGAVLLTGCVTIPTVTPPPDEVIDVLGTEWEGIGHDGDRMYLRFDEGGVIYYEIPTLADTTPGNDFWTQDGTAVRITTNDEFAVYEGVISGETMTGTARNTKGENWDWSVDLLD